MKLHNCETCRIRAYSERKPHSIIARIWRWHAKWCPLLKAHEKGLAKKLEVLDTPAKPENCTHLLSGTSNTHGSIHHGEEETENVNDCASKDRPGTEEKMGDVSASQEQVQRKKINGCGANQ